MYQYAIPAIVSALASQGEGASSGTSSVSKNIASAGYQETTAGNTVFDMLNQLNQFNQAGPGKADIANAYGAQNDLASMLKQYSQGGYAPNQQDFSYAQQAMAPQYEALRQSQVQQQQQFKQQAALSGRGPMDFAFQNKLGQNVMNQNLMLGAQQQQLAMQQPMQRLGFAQDYANLKQGLATQAMQNRLAIAGLGQQIQSAGQNYRLAAAGSTQSQSGQVGSQTGNMLTGAIAGLGTGARLQNLFGGSGSQQSIPTGQFKNPYTVA